MKEKRNADCGMRIGERHVSRLAGLSARQLLCVKLVAEGWKVGAIGRLLRLSDKGVAWNLAEARKKIGCGCVADITKWAVREEVTPLGWRQHD